MTALPLDAPVPATRRRATRRSYLVCPPTAFAVDYAINPWMDPDAPVARDRAITQWRALVATYRRLGHEVTVLDPVLGLPDMVFAANGAVVVDGTAFTSRFRHRERAAEAPAFLAWLAANGYTIVEPIGVLEGEGDVIVTDEVILAGTGFRTERASHDYIAEVTGREVVTLELVDPRYYHLDTALVALDATTIAYLPGAFSPTSRAQLERRYPDAIRVTPQDGAVLGCNAVSDGRHVVLPAEAGGFAVALEERGFVPIPVQLDELRKAGGGPKCTTLELRPREVAA